MFSYLFVYLLVYEVFAAINVLDKGVSPLESDSIGIQFFIDIENTARSHSCVVHTWTKRCCLVDSGVEDCNAMQVYPDHRQSIQPRDLETLVQVYLTMCQHDQVGICEFVLDSRCGRQKRTRQLVNIPFDTRLQGDHGEHNILKNYTKLSSAAVCESLDEDSLAECSPVNCDLKYCGARSFFNEVTRKCVPVTVCPDAPGKELPDVVYVPNSNTCRDLENPLSTDDIYNINTGQYLTSVPERQSVDMKIEVRSNCSTISQNLKLIRDLMLGKLCPTEYNDTSDYSKCFKMAVLKILFYILGLCAALLTFVFCVFIAAGIPAKWRSGALRNQFGDLKSCLKKTRDVEMPGETQKGSFVDTEVRNALLREVITRDMPLELRDNVVDICDRMGKEVMCKKRYRSGELGSSANFGAQVRPPARSRCSDSDAIDSDEKQKLIDK